MLVQYSKVEPFVFRGHTFYVKRDDMIDPLLSGNKYRKFYSLLQMPANTYQEVISHGGTQSNAMLSLAALCFKKGWRFSYYTKPLSHHLKSQPSGNLQYALAQGMELHELEHAAYEAKVAMLCSNGDSNSCFVPQGGADILAERGIKQLAKEIKAWFEPMCTAIQQPALNIVTPSGTGTTAYFLAKALPMFSVFTTATVGDKAYLRSQMERLGSIPMNLHVLESQQSASKKYHFARPYPEFLKLYHDLQAAGIVFDLIYAPQMWQTLLEHRQGMQGKILYIHSGGVMGNSTMLERYKFKNML